MHLGDSHYGNFLLVGVKAEENFDFTKPSCIYTGVEPIHILYTFFSLSVVALCLFSLLACLCWHPSLIF